VAEGEGEEALAASTLKPRPDYIIAATVGDKGPQAVKALDSAFAGLEDEIWEKDAEAELVMKEETFLGSQLKTYTVVRNEKTVYDFAYGVFDGRVLCGGSIANVKAIATRMKEGAAETNLAANPIYMEARKTVGTHDMLAYLNLQVISQASKTYLEATLNAPEFQQQNMMGIMTQGVVDGLSLSSWRSMYFAMDISEVDPEMTMGLRYVEPVGIAKLLTYMNGVAPRPTWIPGTVSEASVSYADMSGMWAELKLIVAGVSPTMSVMALGQLQGMGAQMGVDFDADVMQQLGTEGIMVKQLRELKEGRIEVATGDELFDQAIVISLKEGHTMGTQLASLVANVNASREAAGQEPLLQEMIGGNALYSYDMGRETGEVHVTAKDNYLIIGMGDLGFTRNVLKWMNTPPEQTIWNRPDVAAALATFPADPYSITVSDVAQQASGLLEMLPVLAGAVGSEVMGLVDVEKTPSPETVQKYLNLGIAAGYSSPTGPVIYWRMITPKK